MTKAHAYVEQTRWWIDVVTDRAAVLVHLSPELRQRFARAELIEQAANLKRLEGARPPRNERRIAETALQVQILRRYLRDRD
jgi:hypothetical protein